jgi:DMSO reductase family type II enzyme heme b subunit
MTDADGALPERQGADRLAIEFPMRVDDGAERPYFLFGSARRPVYAWEWTSAPDAVAEGSSTGLGRFTPRGARGAGAAVTHAARYDRGEWAVQFTRALASADTAAAPAFTVGRAIPIGFRAADGSNGEDAVRGAVSSWYAIYLDVPTPPRVYIAPIVSLLLTAALGVAVVWQAQRRERRGADFNQEGGR